MATYSLSLESIENITVSTAVSASTTYTVPTGKLVKLTGFGYWNQLTGSFSVVFRLRIAFPGGGYKNIIDTGTVSPGAIDSAFIDTSGIVNSSAYYPEGTLIQASVVITGTPGGTASMDIPAMVFNA
jgi:hypothetical protein